MSQREKHPTVHVQTVTVTDPDNGAPTQVEIRKDKVTGAMVGIDGSYLEQDVGTVYDPYNRNGVALVIPDDEPPTPRKEPWDRNELQFPRLLTEIAATQDKLDMQALAAEMDLSVEQVNELFDRAEAEWQRIKGIRFPAPGQKGEAAPRYEIAHALVLSTGHITQADVKLLDQCESPVLCFEKKQHQDGDEFGWWIHVSDPEDGFNSDAQILAARYSRAFIGLLHLARQLGCQWLMLDRDGPVRDDLPKFEW
jgi:hypothetical protein